MPFELVLARSLKQAGWKVKIREDERLEPPHVTILRKRFAWRLNLRTGEFMDPGCAWSQIDDGIKQRVLESWELLQETWDLMYPGNPVDGGDDD